MAAERELLRRAAQPISAWRNGGGRTRQVAIEPRDADIARGFRWRVSIAQVDSDGPFSAFPGIDRSLWLLRGNGMILDVDGRQARLDQPLQRIDFAGETPVHAQRIDGPNEDLNVMVARGVACTARIAELAATPAIVELGPGQHVLLAIGGGVAVDRLDLGDGDAVRCSLREPHSLRIAAASIGSHVLLASFPA
jgi:uncharacterized protein